VNERFSPVDIQMTRLPKEDADIRNWMTRQNAIIKKYFFFFLLSMKFHFSLSAPDGNLVERVVGN